MPSDPDLAKQLATTRTQDDVRALQQAADDPAMRPVSLQEFVAPQLKSGWIGYFAPYEAVHRSNIAVVLAARSD